MALWPEVYVPTRTAPLGVLLIQGTLCADNVIADAGLSAQVKVVKQPSQEPAEAA